MSEGNGLPPGWIHATLRDIVIPTGTKNPKADGEGDFLYVDIEALDNSTQKIVAPKRMPNSKAPSRARVAIHNGDVLFSLVRPYLKNIAVVPQELDGQVASTAYCALRPGTEKSSLFVYYLLVQESFIHSIPTYGNSPPAARDEEFFDTKVPIAPPNEQRRIVAAIEEQFARLDAGVAALERTRANLKRYRASVLKAAVEGRLNEEWREEHPGAENASALLERILEERRTRWEEAQLARYEKAGKTPPKGWRSKYEEPLAPDTTDLPDLPEGWLWVHAEQVCDFITK